MISHAPLTQRILRVICFTLLLHFRGVRGIMRCASRVSQQKKKGA